MHDLRINSDHIRVIRLLERVGKGALCPISQIVVPTKQLVSYPVDAARSSRFRMLF